jgi:hypothetical protein
MCKLVWCGGGHFIDSKKGMIFCTYSCSVTSTMQCSGVGSVSFWASRFCIRSRNCLYGSGSSSRRKEQDRNAMVRVGDPDPYRNVTDPEY